MRLSDPVVEVSLEPISLSDLTIHFKDHAFHVHSLVLKSHSKFFAAAFEAADPDDNTGSCSSPSRCVSLNQSLRGVDVQVEHIKTFLEMIYRPHTFQEKQLIELPRDSKGVPIMVGTKVRIMISIRAENLQYVYNHDYTVSSCPTNKTVILISNGHSFNASNLVVSGNPALCGLQRKPLNEFLSQYAEVARLAFYFNCPAVLSMFQSHISNALIDVSEWKRYRLAARVIDPMRSLSL